MKFRVSGMGAYLCDFQTSVIENIRQVQVLLDRNGKRVLESQQQNLYRVGPVH